MQIIVDNVLISYSDTGKGTVLLCVHGWMNARNSFDELTKELQSNFRIIALDLPNFGGSQTTDKIESIDNYANFLASFATKLNLIDYILLGHSNGGQIGIYAVGNKIISPKKLILLASAGIRNNKATAKKLLKLASKVVRPVVPKSFKQKFYKAIGSDYDPDMSPLHKSILKKALSTDIQMQACKITIPTLIINGSEDTSTPQWMGEKLASEIPLSRLEIIEGENHHLHQTSPKLIAEFIRKF